MARTPDRARWAASFLAPPAALAVVAAIAPSIPLRSPPALVASFVLAFACVAAETLIAAATVPPLRARALPWIGVPVLALVAVAVAGTALPSIAAASLVTASLLATGTLVGSVVGSGIEKPGHLLVVAIVSALVDVFSVLHPRGPTAQIVQIEAAVSVLALPWPMLGTDRIEPILGVGDVIFAALYLAAGRRTGLSRRRTVVALALGLAITLAVVIVTGIGIPALPFLGAAIVLAHPEARHVPREDRARAAVGVGALVVLFAVLFLLAR